MNPFAKLFALFVAFVGAIGAPPAHVWESQHAATATPSPTPCPTDPRFCNTIHPVPVKTKK